MSPDAMTSRLFLRRIRVVAVLVDLVDRVIVEVRDLRRLVRCPHCGFTTARVHDRRRHTVHDLPSRGRSTTLTGCVAGSVVASAASGIGRTILRSFWDVARM